MRMCTRCLTEVRRLTSSSIRPKTCRRRYGSSLKWFVWIWLPSGFFSYCLLDGPVLNENALSVMTGKQIQQGRKCAEVQDVLGQCPSQDVFYSHCSRSSSRPLLCCLRGLPCWSTTRRSLSPSISPSPSPSPRPSPRPSCSPVPGTVLGCCYYTDIVGV